MFAGLRLDGFVRGNDEQHEVYPARSRQHVAHEAFVSGDVNKTDSNTIFFQECKPQVDGDPASLFFFEAVRVRSGQGFDQGGLAVVNVPGGSDDDVLDGVRHGQAGARGFRTSLAYSPQLDASEPPGERQMEASNGSEAKGILFREGWLPRRLSGQAQL